MGPSTLVREVEVGTRSDRLPASGYPDPQRRPALYAKVLTGVFFVAPFVALAILLWPDKQDHAPRHSVVDQPGEPDQAA